MPQTQEAAKGLDIPEVKRADPLQHWSWSLSISRMPDYKLSVSDVYREFTLRCLHDDPDLFILSTVEDSAQSRIQDLPSWVPDFSVPLTRSLLAHPDLDVKIPYNASGETERSLTWSESTPTVITLRGHSIGLIQGVLDVEPHPSVPVLIGEVIDFTKNLPTIYSTRETKSEALWRTLTANIGNAPEYEYPAPGAYSEFFLSYVRKEDAGSETFSKNEDSQGAGGLPHSIARVPSGNKDEESSDTDFEDETANHDGDGDRHRPQDLEVAIGRVMKERRFFVTDNELYGIGPQSIRNGDLVVIFAGGLVPYIVRPKNNGSTAIFSLIGECYCHGSCQELAPGASDRNWENVQLG